MSLPVAQVPGGAPRILSRGAGRASCAMAIGLTYKTFPASVTSLLKTVGELKAALELTIVPFLVVEDSIINLGSRLYLMMDNKLQQTE